MQNPSIGTRPYFIEKFRLWEGEPQRGWLEHVTAKKWVDASNFYTARRKAKQHHTRHRPKVAA
jgi:hypothetical protein